MSEVNKTKEKGSSQTNRSNFSFILCRSELDLFFVCSGVVADETTACLPVCFIQFCLPYRRGMQCTQSVSRPVSSTEVGLIGKLAEAFRRTILDKSRAGLLAGAEEICAFEVRFGFLAERAGR